MLALRTMYGKEKTDKRDKDASSIPVPRAGHALFLKV